MSRKIAWVLVIHWENTAGKSGARIVARLRRNSHSRGIIWAPAVLAVRPILRLNVRDLVKLQMHTRCRCPSIIQRFGITNKLSMRMQLDDSWLIDTWLKWRPRICAGAKLCCSTGKKIKICQAESDTIHRRMSHGECPKHSALETGGRHHNIPHFSRKATKLSSYSGGLREFKVFKPMLAYIRWRTAPRWSRYVMRLLCLSIETFKQSSGHVIPANAQPAIRHALPRSTFLKIAGNFS